MSDVLVYFIFLLFMSITCILGVYQISSFIWNYSLHDFICDTVVDEPSKE
jgi:hypothetical protein